MSTFHTYFKSLSKSEREGLAERVETSVAYLWQIAYEQRRCKESLAIELEKASGRAITVEDLRPDVDWAYVRSSAQSIADSEFRTNGSAHSTTASDDAQNPTGGESDRGIKEMRRHVAV